MAQEEPLWNIKDGEPYGIRVERIWQITNSTPDVVVAVVDSGFASAAISVISGKGCPYCGLRTLLSYLKRICHSEKGNHLNASPGQISDQSRLTPGPLPRTRIAAVSLRLITAHGTARLG